VYLVLSSLILSPTKVSSFCNLWNVSLRAFGDLARRATPSEYATTCFRFKLMSPLRLGFLITDSSVKLNIVAEGGSDRLGALQLKLRMI
jgi:hypothetical protein